MRLWSIHPKYLDRAGLIAAWREALLAQAVLDGKTRGYKNHPQLDRFKKWEDPGEAIGCYLHHLCNEGQARGYKFDRSKILYQGAYKQNVTSGQVLHEWNHLMKKLRTRDPNLWRELYRNTSLELHPMFKMVDGDTESWERV